MKLLSIVENYGNDEHTGFNKDAKFFWFYDNSHDRHLIMGPKGYANRIVFVRKRTGEGWYVRLGKEDTGAENLRSLPIAYRADSGLYEKRSKSNAKEFSQQWGPVCPSCQREFRSASDIRYQPRWIPSDDPLSAENLQDLRVCRGCIRYFEKKQEIEKDEFVEEYEYLTEGQSIWSPGDEPIPRLVYWVRVLSAIESVGGVWNGSEWHVPQLTSDQIKDYLYPISWGSDLDLLGMLDIRPVDYEDYESNTDKKINAKETGIEETVTVSVLSNDILPRGLPDLNTVKSEKLKSLLDNLPIAQSNNVTYYLSSEGMSLPDSPRLLSGGTDGKTAARGTATEASSLRGLSDLDVRQILSAIQILKESQIDFNITTDADKNVVGFQFKKKPLSDFGEIKVGNLLDVFKKALPGLVFKLYERNWEGKYGQAFAKLCINSNVETAPFPDLSAGAQAVISPNRKNTVLVLQPMTGAGYVMYRQIEFPSASQRLMLPWHEAVSYFMNNIDRLAPGWQDEKKTRPLLAFRSFLYGSYGHKRADGTTIGRQGLVLSRHAENSIDIINAYIEPGTAWKKFIKSPDRLPDELFEHRIHEINND